MVQRLCTACVNFGVHVTKQGAGINRYDLVNNKVHGHVQSTILDYINVIDCNANRISWRAVASGRWVALASRAETSVVASRSQRSIHSSNGWHCLQFVQCNILHGCCLFDNAIRSASAIRWMWTRQSLQQAFHAPRRFGIWFVAFVGVLRSWYFGSDQTVGTAFAVCRWLLHLDTHGLATFISIYRTFWPQSSSSTICLLQLPVSLLQSGQPSWRYTGLELTWNDFVLLKPSIRVYM